MFDSTVKAENGVANPVGAPAPVPCALQVKLNQDVALAPSMAPEASPVSEGSSIPVPAAARAPQTKEAAPEEWPRPEPTRRERKKQQEDLRERGRNWLKNEPQSWVDRRIRNRSNAAVYIVRQVFKNQRVQLERNWMSYMSDVDTIRDKYEPYS